MNELGPWLDFTKDNTLALDEIDAMSYNKT